MTASTTAPSETFPIMAYTDPDQYKKELERFFYNKHWNDVGPIAKIPNTSDFKRTVVGELPVIVVRLQ